MSGAEDKALSSSRQCLFNESDPLNHPRGVRSSSSRASGLIPVSLNSVPLRIVDTSIGRSELMAIAPDLGDMIKAVVDIERGVMAIGGEMHADEEAALLDDGSRQADLWGINLYPGETGPAWLEFDSMINVRPSSGNRSRDVEDESIREAIRRVVATLVRDA